MKIAITMLCLAASLSLGPAVAGDENPDGVVVIRPEALQWHEVAAYPGLKFALLAGNPAEPGLYVLRAKFPPGVMTRPHFHSKARYVTVLSGTWHAGLGSNFDPADTLALPPGSFMKHPAGVVHFDGAREGEVIVEIRGLGPVITTSADGKDLKGE